MTEKKEKTSAARKVAKKVVDVAKEIANQPMQEQELMQGKVPQEAAPEPKTETPAAEQRQAEKNVGIDLVNKDGINVQSKDNQIVITYPMRKDIDYALTRALRINHAELGFSKSDTSNRVFDTEQLQDKTIAFDSKDLNPDTIPKISAAIEAARTINKEYALEKANAISLFNERIKDKQIVVYGAPIKENKKPTPENENMKFVPSWFVGDILSVGKHLVAAYETSNTEKAFVRLLEISKFPLTVQEYADKHQAALNHLGVKPENLVKENINGKEQEVVVGVERYIAYTPDRKANVAKISPYAPKQEQEKTQTKKHVPTMAM